MKTKQNKQQRIDELGRKLREAQAAQVHHYHFADAAVSKASTAHLTGSGVIITLTVLGGREVFDPVLIRDGLSEETVAALRADFRRSYQNAVAFKPDNEEQ